MRWYRRSVAYVAPDGAQYDAVRADLEDLGLAVRHVDAADRAAAIAADRQVDCLVVDQAPSLDAREVLAAVAEADELVPIVLYPDDGSEALAAAALSYDVDAYVRREEGFDALADALASVFEDLRDPSRRDAEGMLDALMGAIPESLEIYFKLGSEADSPPHRGRG